MLQNLQGFGTELLGNAALCDCVQVQVEKGLGAVIVEREVDGGLESLKLQLPAVITYASSTFFSLKKLGLYT